MGGLDICPDHTTMGSPPPVWGILGPCAFGGEVLRFTPTCVGNTTISMPSSTTSSVHPHLCGEYWWLLCGILGGIGSPPPVWGIPDYRGYRVRHQRFTPTCVGNTNTPSPLRSWRSVHPHLCGEYNPFTFLFLVLTGSPPPVWGILGG